MTLGEQTLLFLKVSCEIVIDQNPFRWIERQQPHRHAIGRLEEGIEQE